VVAEILFLLYEIMVSAGARLQPFAGFCKVFYLLIDNLLYITHTHTHIHIYYICMYIYIYIYIYI